jgi:hypothetical protein
METILAFRSPVSSQALLSELINTDKTNKGNIRNNTSMSYATAASYKKLTTSLSNNFVTVLSNRTNDGFITVQYASRNQSKTASARSFTDGIRSMQSIHSLNQRQAEEAGVMATRR